MFYIPQHDGADDFEALEIAKNESIQEPTKNETIQLRNVNCFYYRSSTRRCCS